jgi:glyoxylate reductase
VVNYAVGHENLDLAALTRARIPAGNTPGVLTEATADLTWALILAVARRITEADRFVRSGGWTGVRYDLFLGMELHGATLGIIGFGAIGQAVARRARGFGMRIVYHSRRRRGVRWAQRLSLEELLEQADIVTVHTPLTRETRGLIGATELSMMKREAIIVNASRGQVIEQVALAKALADGSIAGAGLDVTSEEPIPPSDALLRAPNCIIAPHIGSATRWTREAMGDVAVANIRAGLAGERLPHCVNPSVYDVGWMPRGLIS